MLASVCSVAYARERAHVRVCVSVGYHDADLQVGQPGPLADPEIPEVLNRSDRSHLQPSQQSAPPPTPRQTGRRRQNVAPCAGLEAMWPCGAGNKSTELCAAFNELCRAAQRAGPHHVPVAVPHVLLGALPLPHHDLVLLSRRRRHPVVARRERRDAARLLHVLEQDPLLKLEVARSCPPRQSAP